MRVPSSALYPLVLQRIQSLMCITLYLAQQESLHMEHIQSTRYMYKYMEPYKETSNCILFRQ